MYTGSVSRTSGLRARALPGSGVCVFCVFCSILCVCVCVSVYPGIVFLLSNRRCWLWP